MNKEQQRLEAARDPKTPWKKWGPYLSERQWGTVREDYSDNGNAWDYFNHDQARSRAYHWGEEGLAGISDDKQRLCFALALWAPLSWTVLFAAINSLQSWRLFIERRPVKLTSEEEEIRRLVFRDLPHRKVLQILSIGSWTTLGVGERLIENGKRPDAVSLIVRGKVRVTKDGRVLDELVAGDFVGSALILSGMPAEVDAVIVEPGRAMRWEVGALERYLAANPETRTVMLKHVAHDLAGKMERVTGVSSRPSERAQ